MRTPVSLQLPPLPEPTGRLDDYSEHDMHCHALAIAHRTADIATAVAIERCIDIVMRELDGNGQAQAIALAIREIK